LHRKLPKRQISLEILDRSDSEIKIIRDET